MSIDKVVGIIAGETIDVWNRKNRKRARKTKLLVGEFLEMRVDRYRKKWKRK